MNKYEPHVNYELIERIRRIREDELLHDDSYKFEDDNEVAENRDLSELYNRAVNFNTKELAVVIGVALEKQPLIVFQVIADYVIEILKQGKRGRNNESD